MKKLLPFFALLCFALPSQAANRYWTAAVDNAWDTVGNWWTDPGHSVPAGAIPSPGDTIFIDDNMTSGPSVPITVAKITVSAGGGDFIDFTGATGPVIFLTGNLAGTATPSCTFSNSTVNLGVVTGAATNCDTSSTAGCTINGNEVAKDSCLIGGITVVGNFDSYGSTDIEGTIDVSGIINFRESTFFAAASYSTITCPQIHFRDAISDGAPNNLNLLGDTYYHDSTTMNYGSNIHGGATYILDNASFTYWNTLMYGPLIFGGPFHTSGSNILNSNTVMPGGAVSGFGVNGSNILGIP